MTPLPITHTIDETHGLIATRATDPAAANDFFLKVYRRRASVQYGRSPSEHFATFNGASPAHFAQPEAWLPALFGGGDYELYAYDPVDASKKIGGLINASYPTDNNPPKPKPDFRVMRSAAWSGPRGLVFPPMDDETPKPVQPLHVPAVSQSQAAATQQQTGNAAAVVPDWVIREREAASEQRRQLELQVERERAERKAEGEASKLRAEMDRAQAANDKQMAELRAQLGQQAAAKPATDIGQTVTALLAAAAPIIGIIMASMKDSREAEAKRADAQAAQNTLLLTKLSEPKGMPAEVTMLFEVMKSQSVGSGEMMSRMVEATQAFNGMAVTMIQTMAENLGGNEGNPILDGAKDIIKSVISMQKGTEQAGRRQAQAMVQTAQQLPASQPQPPLARPPQGNGATASGPQVAVPAQVVNFPQTPQGFAGMPPVGPNDTAAAIEGMIRNHDEPVTVVDYIIERINAQDEVLLTALNAHDGDVEALIGDRLGGWAILPANTAYLNKLGSTWQEKAAAAGLVEDPDEANGATDEA